MKHISYYNNPHSNSCHIDFNFSCVKGNQEIGEFKEYLRQKLSSTPVIIAIGDFPINGITMVRISIYSKCYVMEMGSLLKVLFYSNGEYSFQFWEEDDRIRMEYIVNKLESVF